MANHYCTYFDKNYLVQGLALASSLHEHDAEALLWILCLDDETHAFLTDAALPQVRLVSLSELEESDPELKAVKPHRQRVEYYFTLSPCWPRHLLRQQPEIERITYVDADMYFFADPSAVYRDMGDASILVTEHRYPAHLRHHLRCGRFNVGLLIFRNDEAGRDCLDGWRERCLDWCYDRAEDGKYGDQKYLDDWPSRYGARLHVLQRKGVNLAPWNWSQYRYRFLAGRVFVDEFPLELFHFARFAPLTRDRLFQSGQLEYGIMPWKLRQHIYGRYWSALRAARMTVAAVRPRLAFADVKVRAWHGFWRALLPRALFGSDWIRIGPFLVSGRFGLGRFSGHILSILRKASAPEARTPALTGESALDSLPEEVRRAAKRSV